MGEDTEAVMGGVRMGVSVDIKRSDGRIHSAVVSGINVETKSVTVEWFERGETKGKEVRDIVGQISEPTNNNLSFCRSNWIRFWASTKIWPRPATSRPRLRAKFRRWVTTSHPLLSLSLVHIRCCWKCYPISIQMISRINLRGCKRSVGGANWSQKIYVSIIDNLDLPIYNWDIFYVRCFFLFNFICTVIIMT